MCQSWNHSLNYLVRGDFLRLRGEKPCFRTTRMLVFSLGKSDSSIHFLFKFLVIQNRLRRKLFLLFVLSVRLSRVVNACPSASHCRERQVEATYISSNFELQKACGHTSITEIRIEQFLKWPNRSLFAAYSASKQFGLRLNLPQHVDLFLILPSEARG